MGKSRSGVYAWTALITDKLKRVQLPLSTNQQGKAEFLKTRSNNPCTINTWQYYVDGDGMKEHEASIRELCYELADKTDIEYGIIPYAMEISKNHAGHQKYLLS